ncbi:MAG: aspartate/glutamate racemase family protein [Steroidobacteraceae bacterium]
MGHVLVVGGGPASDTLPAHLAPLQSGAVAWRVAAPRVGGFPFTPLDALMTEVGLVDLVLREASADTRAVLVDTFGEYGIAAMRCAVDMPVVGAAASAIAAARRHGAAFGIVTVWPASLDWLYQRQLRALDAVAACVGIRYVGGRHADPTTPSATLGAMHAGDPVWLARILAGIAELADAGADCVIFGCTCMAPVHGRVAARSPIPVICAAQAGVAAVKALLDSERPVVAAEPAAPSASAPSRQRFANWVAGATESRTTEIAVGDDDGQACPVCVLAPDPDSN